MSELAVDYLLDGKYRIVRLVGQGAWATVYEAVHVRIQRRVAIKILNIELATHPELFARFTREAQAATQIESPFVVTMFDAGMIEEDQQPYIVMEFLEGEDLGRRLQRIGRLSEDQAVTYAIHLLSGLADAHATGVVHRDIKPDNLVIVRSKTGEEILKIVDFGISKPSAARSDMLSMTQTDQVLGSPVYMSPEQARGTRHMDHRSDLYSAGVVLFEALTGSLPHSADNFHELMFKVALEDAPDPRTVRPDLDEGLAEIITRALSRDPADRFQSAVEFRTALIEWSERRGSKPSPLYSSSKVRMRAVQANVDVELNAPETSATEEPVALVRPKDGAATLIESDRSSPALPASSPLVSSATSGDLPAPPERRRRALPLVLGAAALVVLGSVVGIFATRPSPAPTAVVPSVSSPETTPPGAEAPPGATAPAAQGVAATTATAETSATAATSATSSSTTSAAPRPVTHVPHRPVTTRSPAHGAASIAAPASTPARPSAAPASSAVVEGRAVRTTF